MQFGRDRADKWTDALLGAICIRLFLFLVYFYFFETEKCRFGIPESPEGKNKEITNKKHK